MARNSSKSRRSRRTNVSSAKPRSYSELLKQEQQNATSVVAAPKPEPTPAPAPRSADAVDWQGEYGTVIADLRQLLVISAALFVLMLALGFII